MKLSHTFRHLDSSESLTQYTEARVAEISRFLLKQGHGHIHYGKTNHEFHVEITINTKEKYYKAVGEHIDAYAAVDEAIEKLERQFIKMKKSVKNHKRPELSRRGRLDSINEQLEYQPRLRKAA